MNETFLVDVLAVGDEEFCFPALTLRHAGCGRMRIQRGQSNPQWAIRCEGCGADIHIQQLEEAETTITRAAITPGIQYDITDAIISGPRSCAVRGV